MTRGVVEKAETRRLGTGAHVSGAVVRFGTRHHGTTGPSKDAYELEGRSVQAAEVMSIDAGRKTKSHALLAQTAQRLHFALGHFRVLLGQNGSGGPVA